MNTSKVDEYWIEFGIRPIDESRTLKYASKKHWVVKNDYASRGCQKANGWGQYASLFTTGSKHPQIDPIIAIKVRYK